MRINIFFKFVLLFVFNFNAFATEQSFVNQTQREAIEKRMQGYKTTLAPTQKKHFLQYGGNFKGNVVYSKHPREVSLLNFSAKTSTGGFDYRFSQLLGPSHFDNNAVNTTINHFREESRSILTRNNSLMDKFSSPRSLLINNNFLTPRKAQYSPRYIGNNGVQRNDRERTYTQSNQTSSDGQERPVLIAWVFDLIFYIRTHPLWSGLMALLALGTISLIQMVVIRMTRPFG